MDKTNAPVSYVYTAPDEEQKLATANLETRSKRGAAKMEVQFWTQQGWKIDQVVTVSDATYQYRGLSCRGAHGPWEITYETYIAEADARITGVLEGIFQPAGRGNLSHSVEAVFCGRPMGGTGAGEIAATVRPDGANYIIELDQGSLSVNTWVEDKTYQGSGSSSGQLLLNVVPADAGACEGR